MSRTPRTAAFKKKVALEALREDKTLGQLASQHNVHAMQISKWKKELIDGAESIFGSKKERPKEEVADREDLERKIGQLTVEIDFLKKSWGANSRGEEAMDRRGSQQSIDRNPVPTHRVASIELLLRTVITECLRPDAHEAGRRDLHRKTLLWFSKDHAQVTTRGTQHQPEKNPRSYAEVGPGGESTRPQYLEEPPGASQIPISPTRSQDQLPPTGVEHRYYVHSIAGRVCISCSSDRLVQSACIVIPAFEQLRYPLLPGGIRRSDQCLWPTRDLQHRPRSAVYLTGICECSGWKRNSLQYGWSRASPRQHFCRTSMEIREI